jgi:hypothetical protein
VRYVITSKWLTAAPAFSVQFWDFTPGLETAASDFDFVPPDLPPRNRAIQKESLFS